ncbi:NYN domain-containing protein [Porphyromonas sp.]
MNQKQRVTFYVDGFNFYYGLKAKMGVDNQWKQAYWIDVVKLFQSFLSDQQELVKVIYFTASPLNRHKSSRQSAFLNANKAINGEKFEVVRGRYIQKQIPCPYCKHSIPRPEEKKTDVNISVRMVGDCVQNKTDIVVLVSADSDLLPPIEFIQTSCQGKKIRAYFPPTIFCSDISQNMQTHKGKVVKLENNLNKFILAKMPDTVEDCKAGKKYTIPTEWK